MKIPARLQESFALSLLLISLGAGAAQPLPGLAANIDDVTVSGISSGAYMAVQFQIAYSGIVRGAGIVAVPALLPAGRITAPRVRCAGR